MKRIKAIEKILDYTGYPVSSAVAIDKMFASVGASKNVSDAQLKVILSIGENLRMEK